MSNNLKQYYHVVKHVNRVEKKSFKQEPNRYVRLGSCGTCKVIFVYGGFQIYISQMCFQVN